MTDLPINTSSSPVKAAAKPNKNTGTNQPDTQEFGDVLARQRNDSVNDGNSKSQEPAKATSASEVRGKKQAAEKNNTENNKPAGDTTETGTHTLPANMLESLLAQPNQTPVLPGTALATDENTRHAALQKASAKAPVSAVKPGLPAAIATAETIAASGTIPAPGAVAASGEIPTSETITTPGTLSPSRTIATTGLATGMGMAVKMEKRAVDPASAPDLAKWNIASGRPVQDPDKALPLAEQSSRDHKGFSAALQDPVLMDLKQQGGTRLQHNNPVVELTGTSVQPAIASSLPAATSPSAPLTINTPFAHTAWADEFSQKITWIANQHTQSAELHLNPPQLGPLDVILKMHGDQATATFTSPHAAVREAIEQAMPKLREMLADSGIMLGNAMVADQPAYKQQDSSAHQAKNRSKTVDAQMEIPAIQESKVSTIRRQQGMVDTFA